MGVYLRIRLPICTIMQYAYTKKKKNRRRKTWHCTWKKQKEKLAGFVQFQTKTFKFVFISKRKGNNDLIPRKHAYNMRLGSLPSWRPSAELYSKTFLFPVPFLKGGSVSSAFISRILTWSVLRGLAGKISVDSTSQWDRQWRLEWLHWNFSKSPGHSWCKDLGPPLASAFFSPKEHIA